MRTCEKTPGELNYFSYTEENAASAIGATKNGMNEKHSKAVFLREMFNVE